MGQNSSDNDDMDTINERDADFSRLEKGAAAQSGSAAASNDGESAEGQETDGGEIKRLRDELSDTRDKYLRALADADNVRKRAAKERSELLKYQGEKLVVDLLQVVDDFELALAHSGTDLQKFRTGIELIYKRFLSVFDKWEIRGEVGVGQAFDPMKHDAISRVPADDAVPGTILNELKRAFFYKDRLLRPAEVVVAAEPVSQEDLSQDSSELAEDQEASDGDN